MNQTELQRAPPLDHHRRADRPRCADRFGGSASGSAGKATADDKPTRIVEQRQSIPLMLRAKREFDGQRLEISPVEPSHALESLTVTLPGASPIEVGSDGVVNASDVASALKGHDNEPKDRGLSAFGRALMHDMSRPARRSTPSGSYTLRYMWKGGGLFGGRSLHLLGLSR